MGHYFRSAWHLVKVYKTKAENQLYHRRNTVPNGPQTVPSGPNGPQTVVALQCEPTLIR